MHSKASSQSASDNEDDEDKIFDAILKYLEENGAVSARQIIKELDISGKTGMNLLDQMDRNGFIGRDKDEDGRTVFKIM